MHQLARVAMVLAAGLTIPAAGWADEPGGKKAKVEFRLAEDKPAEGFTEAKVEGMKEPVYLHKEASLTAADVAEARVATDSITGDPSIEVRFTEAGGKKMAKLSEENVGKRLAVIVGGKVISAPMIRAKIGERAVITGKFSKAEAEKLATAIGGK